MSAPDDVPAQTQQASDIYFLVDRSGSMGGQKWTKTAEALIAFVKATTPHDRVWITFFQSDYLDFAEKPLERDALLQDTKFQSIVSLGTGGGTELLPALRHILGIHQRFSSARRTHIVLITDGQIGNEEAVLKEISGHTLLVHCFGIDHAVNEAFLRELSSQQRGSSVFLTPDDDLVRPVAVLGSRLSRAVFTDLRLEGCWELADTELPDIHAGQVAFAPIRTMGNQSEITVAGKGAAGQPFIVTFQAQAAGTHLPKLIWMKRRIDSLLREGKDHEAIALAKEANLVCRGAAFIAWDDAEKVALAQDEVYQPSLDVPSGVLYDISPSPAMAPAPMSLFARDLLAPGMATLAPYSDEELVSDIFKLKDTKRLIKQLSRTLKLAFGRPYAKKLVNILEDWAKHSDAKQVWDSLCALLGECEGDRNSERLRKAFSIFFLALPDPWQAQAASVLAELATTEPTQSTAAEIS